MPAGLGRRGAALSLHFVCGNSQPLSGRARDSVGSAAGR